MNHGVLIPGGLGYFCLTAHLRFTYRMALALVAGMFEGDNRHLDFVTYKKPAIAHAYACDT